MEAAKAILERDASPIQTVAEAVGYEDVSFFRSLFKRATGMTPAEYRAHFAAYKVREPESVDLARVH
jgi:AraC-like DNA-binding protein